jgi:redox-sensitive bicupin YhaK (pirin superfamily)
MGFATHPHDNMEIITIPLEGEITHQDSMGNEFTLKKGDIQVMSAGTGILHSERNSSASEPLKLLQIWVIPNKREVTPRYDQISFDLATTQNKLQQIISPNPEDVGSWIYQNAWFHIGRFDSGSVTQYTLHDGQNGVYAFVISGQFEIEGQLLNPRDGLGILNLNSFDLKSLSNESQILLMEVPMSV